MKGLFAALIFLETAWFAYGQSSASAITEAGGTNTPGSIGSGSDSAAYYATLNRHVLEFRTQFDLLSGLAQDHKKRAAETPAEQTLRAQWESELAKELDAKAAVVLAHLNSSTKEKAAFERRHPELLVANSPEGGAKEAPSLEEVAFINRLEERLVAVRQEMAETTDTGKLYQTQLLTNSGTAEFSRLSAQLQDNANAVRRLQKELNDLELMRLEFRALRKEH